MKKHGGKIPPGIERCVVPAAPDAWITALENFGTMSFGEVASHAIRFARDGFPMHPLMSEFIKKNEETTSAGRRAARCSCRRAARRRSGEVFVQPELGRTMQYMADEEKQGGAQGPQGRIQGGARRVLQGRHRAHGDEYIEKEGGLMRFEDFADFRVKFEPTVRTRFDDIELHACGPWSQGPVLPMALNILKGYDLKAMGHNSPTTSTW